MLCYAVFHVKNQSHPVLLSCGIPDLFENILRLFSFEQIHVCTKNYVKLWSLRFLSAATLMGHPVYWEYQVHIKFAEIVEGHQESDYIYRVIQYSIQSINECCKAFIQQVDSISIVSKIPEKMNGEAIISKIMRFTKQMRHFPSVSILYHLMTVWKKLRRK